MKSNETFMWHFKAPSGDLKDIFCLGQNVLGSTFWFPGVFVHLSFASKERCFYGITWEKYCPEVLLNSPSGWFPHVEPLWHVHIATVNRQRGGTCHWFTSKDTSVPALVQIRWGTSLQYWLTDEGSSVCGQRSAWESHITPQSGVITPHCLLHIQLDRPHLNKPHKLVL